MLDYDGTLAPFVVKRDQAFLYPGVREALENILNRKGRVTFITGRMAGEVVKLLQLDRSVEVWGCHGFERLLPNGERHLFDLPSGQAEALSKVESSLLAAGFASRVNPKYGSLSLHWRGADFGEIARIRTAGEWLMQPATASGLLLKEFDGGWELRATGRDKGSAVREQIAGVGGDAVCAYLGDDWTDEDGFRAIKGHGLGVLVRGENRTTEADLWIKPPDELLDFPDRWGEALVPA